MTSFKPSFSFNFGQWSPVTNQPVTFFSQQSQPTSTVRPTFSLSYPPQETSFTQGPVNSAIPISLFYPTQPTTVSTTTTKRTTPSPSTAITSATRTFNIKFDYSSLGSSVEGDSAPSFLEVKDSVGPSQNSRKTLDQVYRDNSDSKTVNDIPLNENNRKTRKVDFSSPGGKNITALIKKALSLVRKVEQIGERKRTLQSIIQTSGKNFKQEMKKEKEKEDRGIEKDKSSDKKIIELREKLEDLNEEKKFDDLKSFIQEQSSIANLIRSESSDIKDILSLSTTVRDRDRDRDSKDTRTRKEMISALARLNSISSFLLEENDKTKSNVRQLPQAIKAIVEDEIDGVKNLLEDQNLVVASALRSAISNQENRDDRRIKSDGETDVIILRALAKLNNIAGILLKEQERTEEKTSSALKALPALAKFIQAETSDIKDLIIDNEDLRQSREEDLEELKDAVSQSLANDKLITRAIIKLNDITQLLLRDVNFTSSAVNDKLPRALTALITHETGKIREMIDLQNGAIVDILKESDNLARAEQIIQEAQNIKENFLAEETLSISKDEKVTKESDRLIQLIAPFLAQEEEEDEEETSITESRADKLVEILAPILKKDSNVEEELEEEVKAIDSETEEVLKAQLTGQRTIVQALIKLTNITRTLLSEKEQEETPGPVDEIRSSGRLEKKVKLKTEETEEYYDEDYEDYEDYKSPSNRQRPRTLVETIASSPGNRALRGNQALFEEFVKLAIDRQRWEQAHDVTKIIQSTRTSPSPSPYYYQDYADFDYPDFEDRRPGRRPDRRPLRGGPGRPTRRRPDSFEDYEDIRGERPRSNGRKGPRPNQFSNEEEPQERLKESLQRPNRFQTRPKFQDESLDSRRLREQSRRFEDQDGFPRKLRPSKRPSQRPNFGSTTTTTTEVPFEEYDAEDYYPEEYLEYQENIKESDANYEKQEIRDTVEENKYSSEDRENFPSTSTRSEKKQPEERRQPRPQLKNARPSIRPSLFTRIRGRLQTNRATVATPIQKEETTRRFKPSRPDTELVESRPAFEKPREVHSALAPAEEENTDETEPTPSTVEPSPVIPTVSSGEERREQLLQKLLSHSANKEETTSTVTRSTSTERPSEEVRSSEFRRKFNRGRPFSRIGIPPKKLLNEETDKQHSKENILKKLTALSKGNSESLSVSNPPSTETLTIPITTLVLIGTTTTSRPTAPATASSSTPQLTTTTRATTTSQASTTVSVSGQRGRGRNNFSPRRHPVFTGRRVANSERKSLPDREDKTSEKPRRVQPVFTGNRKPQARKPTSDDIDVSPVSRTDIPRRQSQNVKLPLIRNKEKKPLKSDVPDGKKSEENVPLSDTERKSQKAERNSLLRKLVQDKGERSQRPDIQAVIKEKPHEEMTPLENLFNIINSEKSEEESVKTVVRVTSSSSSSSSSVTSSSSGGRRKKVKKSVRGSREGQHLNLSPQERLVKKVRETLRNDNSQQESFKDLSRPTSPRKKVILRKRKDEVEQTARIGRSFRPRLPGSSQIKSVKVRVRRIDEVPPFPIVY